MVPQFKVAFDIGRCPQRAVYQDTVLISHSHMDHIGGLNFHVASRQLLSLSPPTVVIREENRQGVDLLFEAHRLLDGCDMRADLLSMAPGGELSIRNGLKVRAFPTFHPVPSQGYTIIGTKKKLRKEYSHLTGKEIAQLRKEGVDVQLEVESPHVAFSGDTTADFLTENRANPDVTHAQLLIMECTFVDDEVSIEAAEEFGHTHINRVLASAEILRSVGHVLFIHFSARYKAEEVTEHLKGKLPDWLLRKSSWLVEGYGKSGSKTEAKGVVHGADFL